jgi:hypothetical protein
LWIIERISPRLSLFEQILQFGFGIGPPGGDVLLLHLAEKLLDPAFHLAFKFGPVHHKDNGRVLEPLILFEDQSGSCKQGEGLA